MSRSLAEMEQLARGLFPDERARRAEVLLESLGDPPPSEIDAARQQQTEARVLLAIGVRFQLVRLQVCLWKRGHLRGTSKQRVSVNGFANAIDPGPSASSALLETIDHGAFYPYSVNDRFRKTRVSNRGRIRPHDCGAEVGQTQFATFANAIQRGVVRGMRL